MRVDLGRWIMIMQLGAKRYVDLILRIGLGSGGPGWLSARAAAALLPVTKLRGGVVPNFTGVHRNRCSGGKSDRGLGQGGTA